MVSQKTKQAFWDEVTRNGDKFRRNGRIGRRNSEGRWFLPNGQANKQMVTVTLENQLEVLADRGNTMPSAGTHVRVNRVDGAFVIEGLAVQGSNTSRPASEANTDVHNHNKGYRHFYPIDEDSLLDGGITITPGTSNVTFKRKQYRDADGKPKIYAGGDTVDMSAYGTTLSAGQQAWVLAYINPSTGALTLYEAAGGSAPLNTTTDLDAAISDFYDNVPSGEPYRAIRVNKGTIPYSVYKPAEGYSLENKDMVRFRTVGRYTLAQLGDVGTASPLLGRALVGDGTEYNSYHMYIATPNDPTSADDNADGYREGSIWVNISTDKAFICTSDQTSAAVWQPLGATELSELTDADVTSPSDDDALMYDSVDGRFENRPLAADDIKSGTLAHERGGLEADVSSYAGVPLISGGSTSEIKYNLTATSDPGASDDSSSGYAVGSLWVRTDRDRVWQCVDATSSAAVWKFSSGRVACIANSNASYALAHNSAEAVPLNAESVDTDNMHDVSTSNSRITVPFAGLYQINAAIAYEPDSTFVRDIRFRVNGLERKEGLNRVNASSVGETRLSSSALFNLSAGDYLEVVAYQNSGNPLSVQSGATLQVILVNGESS